MLFIYEGTLITIGVLLIIIFVLFFKYIQNASNLKIYIRNKDLDKFYFDINSKIYIFGKNNGNTAIVIKFMGFCSQEDFKKINQKFNKEKTTKIKNELEKKLFIPLNQEKRETIFIKPIKIFPNKMITLFYNIRIEDLMKSAKKVDFAKRPVKLCAIFVDNDDNYYVKKFEVVKYYYLLINSLLGEYKILKNIDEANELRNSDPYVIHHKFLDGEYLNKLIKLKTFEKEPFGSVDSIFKQHIKTLNNNCVVITRGKYLTKSNQLFYVWYGFFKQNHKFMWNCKYEINKLDYKIANNLSEILAVKNAINYAINNKLEKIDIYYNNLAVLDWLWSSNKTEYIEKYKKFIWKSEYKIKIIMHKLPYNM